VKSKDGGTAEAEKLAQGNCPISLIDPKLIISGMAGQVREGSQRSQKGESQVPRRPE
jgi:hypothetical protein